MSEPVITPAAVYTFGGAVGAGYLLGMPVDAVALGAVASAAVTMISQPQSRWMVVAYTVIGGLLGGAFAPPLTHWLIGESGNAHPALVEQRMQFAHVFAPVVVGLMWQFFLKIARTLLPTFEKRADELVEGLFDLLPWRKRK